MKPITFITLVLLMILSSACGPSPEEIATQTAIAEIAIATQTAVAVSTIAAETSVAATATAVASAPKPGHWEGSIVLFEVTPDGRINNLRIVPNTDLSSCGIEVQEIVIEQGNTFAFTQLDPLNHLSKDEKEFLTANKLATVITTDKGEEFEILRINGRFDSATSGVGEIYILSCNGRVLAGGARVTWNAEWKNP